MALRTPSSRCSASLSYRWCEGKGYSRYEEAGFTHGLETAVVQDAPLLRDRSVCNCCHIAKTQFAMHRVAAAVPGRPDPVSGRAS